MGVAFGIAASARFESVALAIHGFSPTAIATPLLFACAAGMFRGYYPAQKVSQLDPIEPLRFE